MSDEEHGDEQHGDQVERTGTLHPITDRALAVCVVVGLVAGWSLHPLGDRILGNAPLVSWAQPLTLLLVVAVMSFLAWDTWRTVQVRGRRLEVHLSVNRLVLARACALAGSLVAGGYTGFAVSWLGDASALADDQLVRAVVAALAGLGVMLASLVLERACRTPDGRARP